MFLLCLAAALEGEEERGDLLLGAFLREHFHINILCVVGGRASFFGLMAGLFAAFVRSQLQPVVTSVLQLKTITDYPVFGLISHTDKEKLARHNRKHLFYFLLLTGALVAGYTAFVVNEMVFGITMKHIWGWIA